MVSESDMQCSDLGLCPGMGGYEFVFQFLEGSNEGKIDREAGRRSSMVKCRETPLEGGVM